jgi:hypothetical protein
VATFNRAKSKVSAVLFVDGGAARVIASAINISSDGMFITAKQPLAGIPPEKLAVQLASGEVGKVQSVALDPAANVAMFKAELAACQLLRSRTPRPQLLGNELCL